MDAPHVHFEFLCKFLYQTHEREQHHGTCKINEQATDNIVIGFIGNMVGCRVGQCFDEPAYG